MSIEYFAKCNNCFFKFILHKGGGYTAYQNVCAECGSSFSLPRKGPIGHELPFTEGEIVDYLKDKSKWTKDGRVFTQTEVNIIRNITGVCSCGGEMVPDYDERVTYRCPKCKSLDLSLMGGDIVRD